MRAMYGPHFRPHKNSILKITLVFILKTDVKYKRKSQTHNKIIKILTACSDFIILKNFVCSFDKKGRK